MCIRKSLGLMLAPALVAALSAVAGAQTGAARVGTYDNDGQTYFAMSLMAPPKADPAQKNEVVILVDTSASQAGRYRDAALRALDSLLANLRPDDRVQLMAVDGKAVPMSAGFVAAGSPEMRAGVAKLHARAPLGATDLENGLRAAAAQFAAPGAARTVIYIGDAMSKANGFTESSLGSLVAELRNSRVSLSGYVVGLEQNTQLLAALANHTGGVVALDGPAVDVPVTSGRALAESVQASVIWPSEMKLSGNVAASYPALPPPLRTDRDSILVGRLAQRGDLTAQVSGLLNGSPVTVEFKANTEKSNEDFAFLPRLVDLAASDSGLSLPTVGSPGLRAAALTTLASAHELAKLGHEALSSGNVAGAQRAATAALARDPGNPQAQAVRNAASRATVAPDPALRLAGHAEGGSGSLLDEFLAEQPGFLGNVERERGVIAGKLRAEVEDALNAARHMMATDPDTAQQSLKLMLVRIESSTDLDAGLRSQLRQQVEDAIRQATQEAVLVAEREARRLEEQAIAIELERLTTELAQRELRLKQIMDRFDSLMEEGRYQVADEEISPEIERLAPGTRLEASVIHGGRMQRAAAENEIAWRNKENNFLRTMFMVEISLIPFPDEPPIVYMPADQWEDLTIRRQKYKAVDLGKQGGSEARIFDELNKIMPVGMEFVETPLKDAIQYLQDQHRIPIVLNTKTLNDAGINPDTPVTKNLKGITLRSALRLMLKELDLTYVVRDEVLQITTPDDAESQLVTKVYPVGDLVVPIGINSNLFGLGGVGGMNGGGGMMGGMGGGMGGMGGGMGGGMMGGGMGGMGGMMGGGMFAVEDELKLGTKKPAVQDKPEPQPEVRRPAAAKIKAAQPLKIEPAAGETPAAAWDRHFAAEQERIAKLDEEQAAAALAQSLAAVRETIRKLREEHKFADIPVIIQAALRHNHIESWMYESLALAMRADAELKKQPLDKDELERALLSAVDFAQHENQVIMTAAYMAQIGLHERALKLYQQIGNADPSRAEPFVQGLALAQKLNDVNAIQWACVGVLSHAWTGEHRHIGETAYRVGKSTYEKLLAAGKKSEAEAFDKAVRAAQQRDCLVLVTWTGDADIDVSIEEPSGTVVSQRQPRSIAGGVHLGDVSAAGGKATAKGFSEAYVCPQGFDGQYRVHIRSIWGRPTGGKVTVEVITNFGTAQQWSKREQIPIDEKNALVVFDLKNGRRTDSLPEAQIAQVAKAQEANNRMLLAQQLAQYEDSEVSRNYAASIEDGKRGGAGPGGFRRRGVGYRPQITTLPEGANFSSNAVISADRRYVRVSPSPTFSQIVEVNTFNFVTGQGNTQGQGQGGVGGGGVGGGGVGGGGGFGGGGFF